MRAHRRHDAEQVRLVWQRGPALVAYHRNLVGVRWTGVPTTAQLAALATAHRAARTGGQDVLLINDIAALVGSVHVDSGAHAHMIDLVTEGHARTRAVAHVVEVPGPVGLAVRTFLRGLEHVVGSGRVSTRAFEHLSPAATWLASNDLDGVWRAEEIVGSWHVMAGALARSLAA